MDHSRLLQQAKQHQKKLLAESHGLNYALRNDIARLIESNSRNDADGPACLDKMTTIHQLDKEIDRQLNRDIAVNYEKLVAAKHKAQRFVARADMVKHVPDLQRRVELVDQELRILEQTLATVQRNA